jgi:hypothetical protein
MKTKEQPYIEAELTTSLNGKPFLITGQPEVVTELYEAAIADYDAQPVKATKAVEAPIAAVPVQNQYTDLSELPSRQIARMKLRSRVYDMVHRTNMTGLLIERINEDRDVAFARSLGLVSVTHCQRHEKAVAKLRQLV